MSTHPYESYLREARLRQQTDEFKERYRLRSAVERTQAELVQHGVRKTRYLGHPKRQLQRLWTAAVVNLNAPVPAVRVPPERPERAADAAGTRASGAQNRVRRADGHRNDGCEPEIASWITGKPPVRGPATRFPAAPVTTRLTKLELSRCNAPLTGVVQDTPSRLASMGTRVQLARRL